MSWPVFADLFACFTEASLAALIESDGFDEIFLVELGPEFVGDHDFGICDFPEQEIADAHLAACADEQIGILAGESGGGEP